MALFLIAPKDILLGQDTTIVYKQLWTDFNLKVSLDEHWSYGGDVGYRTQLDDNSWSQLIVRPTFHYKHSDLWKFGGGIGSFNTGGKDIENTYELRLQGEAELDWPRLPNVSFRQRIRMEQRMFWFEDGGSSWNIRGRYYVGAFSRKFHIDADLLEAFYAAASAEFFTPVYKESEDPVEYLVNSTRLTVVGGVWFNSTWKFELDYTWQRGRLLDLDEFQTSEHLIRLRLYMYIDKRKA